MLSPETTVFLKTYGICSVSNALPISSRPLLAVMVISHIAEKLLVMCQQGLPDAMDCSHSVVNSSYSTVGL